VGGDPSIVAISTWKVMSRCKVISNYLALKFDNDNILWHCWKEVAEVLPKGMISTSSSTAVSGTFEPCNLIVV